MEASVVCCRSVSLIENSQRAPERAMEEDGGKFDIVDNKCRVSRCHKQEKRNVAAVEHEINEVKGGGEGGVLRL